MTATPGQAQSPLRALTGMSARQMATIVTAKLHVLIPLARLNARAIQDITGMGFHAQIPTSAPLEHTTAIRPRLVLIPSALSRVSATPGTLDLAFLVTILMSVQLELTTVTITPSVQTRKEVLRALAGHTCKASDTTARFARQRWNARSPKRAGHTQRARNLRSATRSITLNTNRWSRQHLHLTHGRPAGKTLGTRAHATLGIFVLIKDSASMSTSVWSRWKLDSRT
jgi:hypothetical protein